MRILRAGQHRRMPWKNGGGETTEIIASPEGAGLDEFGWRVSMASVAADGPFSRFPDIDRTLCVIQGEGLALTIAGKPEVVLTAGFAALSFPRRCRGDIASREGADHRPQRHDAPRALVSRGDAAFRSPAPRWSSARRA